MKLPKGVSEAIYDYAREVENTMCWASAPGAWRARGESLAALGSAILAYGDAEYERGYGAGVNSEINKGTPPLHPRSPRA